MYVAESVAEDSVQETPEADREADGDWEGDGEPLAVPVVGDTETEREGTEAVGVGLEVYVRESESVGVVVGVKLLLTVLECGCVAERLRVWVGADWLALREPVGEPVGEVVTRSDRLRVGVGVKLGDQMGLRVSVRDGVAVRLALRVWDALCVPRKVGLWEPVLENEPERTRERLSVGVVVGEGLPEGLPEAVGTALRVGVSVQVRRREREGVGVLLRQLRVLLTTPVAVRVSVKVVGVEDCVGERVVREAEAALGLRVSEGLRREGLGVGLQERVSEGVNELEGLAVVLAVLLRLIVDGVGETESGLGEGLRESVRVGVMGEGVQLVGVWVKVRLGVRVYETVLLTRREMLAVRVKDGEDVCDGEDEAVGDVVPVLVSLRLVLWVRDRESRREEVGVAVSEARRLEVPEGERVLEDVAPGLAEGDLLADSVAVDRVREWVGVGGLRDSVRWLEKLRVGLQDGGDRVWEGLPVPVAIGEADRVSDPDVVSVIEPVWDRRERVCEGDHEEETDCDGVLVGPKVGVREVDRDGVKLRTAEDVMV